LNDFFAAYNSRLRILNHKLAILEDLEDEEVTDALAEGIHTIETQALAELINMTIEQINRLLESKPDVVVSIIEQVTQSIDYSALHEMLNRFSTGDNKPVSPAARAIVPPLVQGFCRILEPARDGYGDEYEDGITDARNALRSLLIPGEGTA
jgi:hypothetical protein